MNELQEQILALLVAKFQGERKDGLQQLALLIGTTAANIEEATEAVDKLAADKVSQFVKDYRRTADAEIAKANKTYEDGLRRKYDFKEKEAQPTVQTPVTPPEQQPGGALTAEQIRQIIREETKDVRDGLSNLNGDKLLASRREQLVAKLDAAKVEGRQRDMVLRNFDRAASTFANDDDFNGYLTEVQSDIDAIAQENADKGLHGHEKPLFGAVNDKGVSAAVADYIASKSENKSSLSGKEV